ncbi:MAG TPA: class I SAM-dependent methyltransferase, partial [Solirubrobacterales bacterium]
MAEPVTGTTKPSRDSAQFAGQVNRMFDRIASRYDLLNSVMSAGLHHRWRERAADRAELGPGDSALDVCCGTG